MGRIGAYKEGLSVWENGWEAGGVCHNEEGVGWQFGDSAAGVE